MFKTSRANMLKRQSEGVCLFSQWRNSRICFSICCIFSPRMGQRTIIRNHKHVPNFRSFKYAVHGQNGRRWNRCGTCGISENLMEFRSWFLPFFRKGCVPCSCSLWYRRVLFSKWRMLEVRRNSLLWYEISLNFQEILPIFLALVRPAQFRNPVDNTVYTDANFYMKKTIYTRGNGRSSNYSQPVYVLFVFGVHLATFVKRKIQKN